MEDVAAVTARLRERVESATRTQHQAEYARQQAEQNFTGIVQQIQAEFGVTPEQARALRDDLDRQIAAETAAIEKALDEAGL